MNDSDRTPLSPKDSDAPQNEGLHIPTGGRLKPPEERGGRNLLTHHREAPDKLGSPPPGGSPLKPKAPDPEFATPDEAAEAGWEKPAGAASSPPRPEPPPSPPSESSPGDSTPGAVEPHRKATGLTEKMADIHSGKSSTGGSDSEDPNRSTSSLPETMARLQHRHDHSEAVEDFPALAPRARQGSADSRAFTLDDPDPGVWISGFRFWFRFGRYAGGVMLAQSAMKTTVLLAVCGFGSLPLLLRWLVPPAPGPGSAFTPEFLLRVFGLGTVAGVAAHLLLSLVVLGVLRAVYKRVGLMFVLRMVVNAFTPMAVLQAAALIAAWVQFGEAFWRGAAPEWYSGVEFWGFPALWAWSGARTAQAVSRVFRLKRGSTFLWMLLLSLLSLAAFAPSHPKVADLFPGPEGEAAWVEARRDFVRESPGGDTGALNRLERVLPFRDVERRRLLYLMRLETASRAGRTLEARADAWRLDRSAPEDSAYDHLGKGLNLLLQDRPDLALARLEKAVARDPACAPAHHWLAVYHLKSDPERAASHARVAYELDDNVYHMALWVNALFALHRYGEIWDLMLDVDAPIEAWHTETLRAGGVAAKELGKTKRAEQLLELAAEREGGGKTPVSPAPDVEPEQE